MIARKPLFIILMSFAIFAFLKIGICPASTFKALDSKFSSGTELSAVHFSSSQSGIVAGGNRVKKSSDGGLNWITTSASPAGTRINDLFARSSTNYWAATDTGLYQSSNGGSSWVSRVASASVEQLCWVSLTTGFCVTSSGIYRSTNYGVNWSRVLTVSAGRISMWNLSAGFCADSSQVFYTTNSWKNYSVLFPVFLNNIRSIVATGINSLIIAGFDFYYDIDYGTEYYTGIVGRSTNAGSNWSIAWSSDQGIDEKYTLEDICFIGDEIFSVGRFVNSGNEGWILVSRNQGASWTNFNLAMSSGYVLNSVSFVDKSRGWACGEKPTLFGPEDKPFTRIEEPGSSQTVGLSVRVKGTVSDSDLNYWRLEVGAGETPLSFDTISSGFELAFKSDVGVWGSELYPEGTYTLKLSAFNSGGFSSSYSTKVFLDASPPDLNVSSPAGGSEVWGSGVPIVAQATDWGLGVKNVKFYIDGIQKFTDSFAPYRYEFDSKQYENGSHSIKVSAEDKGGRVSEKIIDVGISNGLFTKVTPVTVSFASGFPGQSVENGSSLVEVKNHVSSTASVFLKIMSDSFCADYPVKKYFIPIVAGKFSTAPTAGAAIVAGQRSLTTAFATIAYNISPSFSVSLLQNYSFTYPAFCCAGDYNLSASYEAHPEPIITTSGTYNIGENIKIFGCASCPDFSYYRLEAISDSKVSTIQPDSSTGIDTYIEENSNSSFGQLNQMLVRDDDVGFRKYSIIKFPLSVSFDSEIYQSILYLTSSYNYGGEKYWYQMPKQWSESSSWVSLDADSLWPNNCVLFGLLSGGIKGDLTDLTEKWHKQLSSNYGIYIRGSDSYGEVSYFTCEATSSFIRPLLKVTYGDGIYETKYLSESFSPVIEGQLVKWDTTNFRAGPYILRLKVYSKKGLVNYSEGKVQLKEQI